MQELEATTDDAPAPQGSVSEVALLALRLGCTAFGGPAAHIAMLRDAVVVRRHWLSDAQFADLLGATNLIPGPNSTEMVLHVGQVRAGWRGLLAAGIAFILPAALIMLACAWAYVAFGKLPAASWLLYGLKPVIIVIIGHAIWGLARTLLKGGLAVAVTLAVLGLALLGLNELVLLFGSGFLVMLVRNFGRRVPGETSAALLPLGSTVALFVSQTVVPVSLGQLFWNCLKIGALLYGSGYVLLAFLRNEFVMRLGWLTNQQLLDGIALGQLTPGPLFTTATFVGYVVAGLPGALLATLGIFLPSFVFVASLNPLIPRLRRSPWMRGFLDGVNLAALALMGAVLWELGRSALSDWLTVLVAVLAAVLLLRFKLNSAWLLLGGALITLLVRWLAPGLLP